MKIEIDKKHLINELIWCLDMNYPCQFKRGNDKRVFNLRVSHKNRKLMATGIANMLSVYKCK